MFKSFFEARAALDTAIRADEITVPAPALAIFRLLLEHAFYTDDNRYGLVNGSDVGVKGISDIGKLTGYGERAARTHLRVLEDAKLIHRQPRPKWSGGREPDEITIVWVAFHDVDYEAEPAPQSTEPAPQSTEPARDAVSFLGKKEKKPQKPLAPSGQDQDRGQEGSPAEWDGDQSILVQPDRVQPGTHSYYVRPDGTVRQARGFARPGEVRATIDFLALQESGVIGTPLDQWHKHCARREALALVPA